MNDGIRTAEERSLDPSLLMDNAACASQCAELLDDHPTRQAVLLNVYRPLWDEIVRLSRECTRMQAFIDQAVMRQVIQPPGNETCEPFRSRITIERVKELRLKNGAGPVRTIPGEGNFAFCCCCGARTKQVREFFGYNLCGKCDEASKPHALKALEQHPNQSLIISAEAAKDPLAFRHWSKDTLVPYQNCHCTTCAAARTSKGK